MKIISILKKLLALILIPILSIILSFRYPVLAEEMRVNEGNQCITVEYFEKT